MEFGFSEDRPDFIFYLKLSPELSPAYLMLAQEFNNYGITLVAVEAQDLLKLGPIKGKCVVCYCDSIGRQKKFLEYKKTFLDFSVSSGALSNFHISSFGMSMPASYSGGYQKIKNYTYFSLPIGVQEVCAKIAEIYRSTREGAEKWPGGRRAKLSLTKLA